MGLSTRFDPLTRLVRGTETVGVEDLGGAMPGAEAHGDVRFYVVQADVSARYALASWAELFFGLPYRALVMRADKADEHHRSKTFQGLGDLRLGAKVYPVTAKRVLLGFSLGLSLPTGPRNRLDRRAYLGHLEAEDLGVELPEHSHLQLGTGTFDPLLGAELLLRFSERWMLSARIDAALPLCDNSDGYYTAPSGTAALGPVLSLPRAGLLLALFLEGALSGRDHLSAEDVVGPQGGRVDGDLDVPNTGRFELAIAPAATWWASRRLSFTLTLRIPVYTRVRERSERQDVQLTEPLGVGLGVAYDLDL